MGIPAEKSKDKKIILLYKGLQGRAKIHTDELIQKNKCYRNQHSLAFQILSASTNAYLYSFPLRLFEIGMTSLILLSLLKCQMFLSVSKFTFLVRAWD